MERTIIFAHHVYLDGKMPIDIEELKDLFSEYWQIDKKKINLETRLDDESLKNKSSIRFLKFIAAIESNFSVRIKNVNNIWTLKDIIDNIE